MIYSFYHRLLRWQKYDNNRQHICKNKVIVSDICLQVLEKAQIVLIADQCSDFFFTFIRQNNHRFLTSG